MRSLSDRCFVEESVKQAYTGEAMKRQLGSDPQGVRRPAITL